MQAPNLKIYNHFSELYTDLEIAMRSTRENLDEEKIKAIYASIYKLPTPQLKTLFREASDYAVANVKGGGLEIKNLALKWITEEYNGRDNSVDSEEDEKELSTIKETADEGEDNPKQPLLQKTK